MICCINHRRQYCVVAKKSSSGVWQTGSNTHASTAAIWFQASWQPPLGPSFLMNKIEIIQESSSECYCECCQHYHPEASEQRAAARLRWGGSHLPVSVLGGCRALPTRGSTYLKSSPRGKRRDTDTKCLITSGWFSWWNYKQLLFFSSVLLCSEYMQLIKKKLSLKNSTHHLKTASSTKLMLYKYLFMKEFTMPLVLKTCLHAFIPFLFIITFWVGRQVTIYPENSRLRGQK